MHTGRFGLDRAVLRKIQRALRKIFKIEVTLLYGLFQRTIFPGEFYPREIEFIVGGGKPRCKLFSYSVFLFKKFNLNRSREGVHENKQYVGGRRK